LVASGPILFHLERRTHDVLHHEKRRNGTRRATFPGLSSVHPRNARSCRTLRVTLFVLSKLISTVDSTLMVVLFQMTPTVDSTLMVVLFSRKTGTGNLGNKTRDAGRGTRDAGRRTPDAGRRTRDAGRGTWDVGRGTWDVGRGNAVRTTYCITRNSVTVRYVRRFRVCPPSIRGTLARVERYVSPCSFCPN
jgi:hypothetical protein